jgi:hypothetical protein
MGEKTGEGQSGGVNLTGAVGSVGGDIVGRDKIVGAAALDGALRPLIEAIGAAPTEKRADAEAKLAAAASAVVSAFATPILGDIAGPVTGFVLDKLRGK